MIRCKKCGFIGVYTKPLCPECNEKYILTPEEIDDKIEETERAKSLKQYELYAEGHHILADLGRTESQKEYASILEKGSIVKRDLDTAMSYYYMAAEKNDSYSAYRYSKLAERTSEKAASFWLMYAAILGCVESYPALADKLSASGDDELANYYYAMSAAYDDTDSIVTLAKRYYNGIGIEESQPYAKWYMDKLTLPPIHAIKMAYKLRGVKAEDPGMPVHPDYDKMLRRLLVKAEDYGYASAYHSITSILSERGDVHSRMKLGLLYAEGKGCERDAEKALYFLEGSAKLGNPEAYKHMGDIHLIGELVPRNTKLALECYKEAAKLGMTNAYETMGDIFYEGKMLKRDISKAIRLYELGAQEGHSSAEKKANDLKDARERLCEKGRSLIKTDPDEALKSFAISSNMGYIKAYKEMARCFLRGTGIKPSRQQAYLWYQKAVNAGDEDALFEFGLCHSRGVGTAFDFDRAVELLSKSARLGNPKAKDELSRLMGNKKRHLVRAVYSRAMRLIYQRKFSEAEKLLRLCLKFNHAKGIYTLGCLNEFGLGIETNRELAFRLYETAFDLKFRDPRSEYKLRILKTARNYK